MGSLRGLKLVGLTLSVVFLFSYSRAAEISCQNFYQDLARSSVHGPALTVSIFIGNLDNPNSVENSDYSAGFAKWLRERMTSSCSAEPSEATGFCDFVEESMATDVFFKLEKKNPWHLPVIVKLRRVEDYRAEASAESPEMSWLKGLQEAITFDSATFVVSHSRGGIGPDPYPTPNPLAWLKRRYIDDYFSYVKKGLLASEKPNLLVLNLCNSDGHYRERVNEVAELMHDKSHKPIFLTARDKDYELQFLEIMELTARLVGGLAAGSCPEKIRQEYEGFSPLTQQKQRDHYLWFPTEFWQ